MMILCRVFDSMSGHYLESCSAITIDRALRNLENTVHYTMYDRHEIHRFKSGNGIDTQIEIKKVKLAMSPKAEI